jgi:membrane-bound lytic murein transglycosylase A
MRPAQVNGGARPSVWRRFAVRGLAATIASALSAAAAAQIAPAAKSSRIKAMTSARATFEPVGFGDIPGWPQDDHADAFQAFLKSCSRVTAVAKSGSAGGAVPPAAAFLAICDAAKLVGQPDAAAARKFFEAHFTPHKVRHAGATGLLTGYYEPVLDGARLADAKYKVPIYKRPADLANIVAESMRGAQSGGHTHGRKTDGGIVPYATRKEIEGGALAGQGLELMYLADPVDVFFMQVQGSGRIRLPDGQMVRVHYDGKNGYPYTSIGRHLIDTGVLTADQMSLDALAKWLRADPERGRKVMWNNASYVFFRELTGAEAGGPLGVIEIPLTDGRSLAVDAGVHAIGTPIFVTSPTLSHATKGGAFERLMIAQDVGSAIKGPERGDIYFGSGDEAGRLAGVTKHQGNFYVLLPRADAAKP